MGIGGISIWQLVIVLAIVMLLFGTKKLRSVGGDLGSAVRNFRKSMKDDESRAEIPAFGEGPKAGDTARPAALAQAGTETPGRPGDRV